MIESLIAAEHHWLGSFRAVSGEVSRLSLQMPGATLIRRYELLPNIVATVKGYAKHEQEILERVIELCNVCLANHGSVRHQVGTEKQLVGAVQKLLAVIEAYPDLKADKNFLELQKELVNTEDRIQAARRFYNGNVRDYRIKFNSFPSKIIAHLFHFSSCDFFDVDPIVRAALSVKDSF